MSYHNSQPDITAPTASKMTAEPTRSPGPSRAVAVLDLLVKIVATGALIGILVLLLMINKNLTKVVEGDKLIRVGVTPTGGSPFPIAATVSNPFSGSAFSVDIGDVGSSSFRPLYVESAN